MNFADTPTCQVKSCTSFTECPPGMTCTGNCCQCGDNYTSAATNDKGDVKWFCTQKPCGKDAHEGYTQPGEICVLGEPMKLGCASYDFTGSNCLGCLSTPDPFQTESFLSTTATAASSPKTLCNVDSDCTSVPNTICMSGWCQPPLCSSTDHCAPNFICQSGRCQINQSCTSDLNCPSGYSCDTTHGKCFCSSSSTCQGGCYDMSTGTFQRQPCGPHCRTGYCKFGEYCAGGVCMCSTPPPECGPDACGNPGNACPNGYSCFNGGCINPDIAHCGASQCGTASGAACNGPFGTNVCPQGYTCQTIGPTGKPGQFNMCVADTGGSTPWNAKIVLDAVLGPPVPLPPNLSLFSGGGTGYTNFIPPTTPTRSEDVIDINGNVLTNTPLISNLGSSAVVVFNNLAIYNAYPDTIPGNFSSTPHQTNLQVVFITDSSQAASFTPSQCAGGVCRELGGGMPCQSGLSPVRVSPWVEVPFLSGAPFFGKWWFSVWACSYDSLQCPAGFLPATIWDAKTSTSHYGCQRLQPKPGLNPCYMYNTRCTMRCTDVEPYEMLQYDCPTGSIATCRGKPSHVWDLYKTGKMNNGVPGPIPKGFLYSSASNSGNIVVCNKPDCNDDLVGSWTSGHTAADDNVPIWYYRN